jgi:hypothetical protein
MKAALAEDETADAAAVSLAEHRLEHLIDHGGNRLIGR